MNGHAELVIDGETIGLKFGMAAIEQISVEMVKAGITDLNSTPGRAFIFYAGYCNWCIVQRKPTKFEYEVFYDLVEAAYHYESGKPIECEAVMQAFVESRAVEEVLKKKGQKAPTKAAIKKAAKKK